MFVPNLSEAAAVRLIETILFGAPAARPCNLKPATRRLARARKLAPRLSPDPVSNSNDAFFRSIVLRKRAPAPTCPVTLAPVTRKPAARARPTYVPSFPRGLCYLAGVAPSDRAAAMLTLGSYPTVTSLLSSWLFQPSGLWLVAVSTGLYHAVTTPEPFAIPVTLGTANWVVGADNADFPALPRNPAPRYYEDSRPRAPLQSNNAARPPHPPRPSNFFPRNSNSFGLPAFSRGCGRGRGRGSGPAPFQAQHFDAPCGRGSAPHNPPREQWQDANRSPFDIAVTDMKKSLEDLPRDLAVDTWNDLSAWIKDHAKGSTSDKTLLIPLMEAYFGPHLEKARKSAADRQQILESADNAHKLSVLLADKYKALDELHAHREQLTPDEPSAALDTDIEALKTSAHTMEAIIEAKEKEALVANNADDVIADNADFVPLEEPEAPSAIISWPEDNYEDFATKRAAALAPLSITGKLPAASLLIKQKVPTGSKTLMPHALELFSSAEIDGITPKSVKSRWCDFYEDPLELVKCWPQNEFVDAYNKPGFHFMIARIAQIGAQFMDSKYSVLKSKLSDRWKVDVNFERLRPRMDWMLATIPALTEVTKEILSTSIIRLQDGNAVYVVRHFNVPAKIRDLEVTVANTITDPGILFGKLKSRCLEFEKSGVRLGWRVAGVRAANAPAKYRATFYLDSPDEYWPWSHGWSHPHGSVPEMIPLLNFDPVWKARKPYACQICYNSDHHTTECPLPHVKIGGVPLVSAVSRGMVLNRKPAERRGWTDDLLAPLKGGSKRKQTDTVEAPPGNPPIPSVLPLDDGDDVFMVDDAPRPSDDDGLAAAKTQFNNPFSQLKAAFPQLSDGNIRAVLQQASGSVALAIDFINHSAAHPPTPKIRASGSGLPQPAVVPSYKSMADFIFEKLTRVFTRVGTWPRADMINLISAQNGDLPLVVSALQDASLKFSWPTHTLTQEWEEWVDNNLDPQAATLISTTMSGLTLLADSTPPAPPAPPKFAEHASFLSTALLDAGVHFPTSVDMDALAARFHGQFMAILAPITDWPSTPTTSMKREALESLVKRFPGANEDTLLLVLEEFGYDSILAQDTILLPRNRDAAIDSLYDAFPKVPRLIINDAWAERPGQYLHVFHSLMLEYHPLWRPEPPKPSALSLSPPVAAPPVFIADGYAETEKEADWWKTLVGTVRWQVLDPEPDNNTWRMVTNACQINQKMYSPRLTTYVEDLLSDNWKAPLAELSVLPAYSALCDLAGTVGRREDCKNIVSILASHGMVAPGALTWAFEVSQRDPTSFRSLRDSISQYRKFSSSIWSTRNKSLLAYRADNEGPRPGAEVLDVDASSAGPSSPALTRRARAAEADNTSLVEVPISPSVSRATRTSTGSHPKAKVPYPAAKPEKAHRASDDDVRAAQSLIHAPSLPAAKEVIEISGDSEMSESSFAVSPTIRKRPSVEPSPEPESTDTEKADPDADIRPFAFIGRHAAGKKLNVSPPKTCSGKARTKPLPSDKCATRRKAKPQLNVEPRIDLQ